MKKTFSFFILAFLLLQLSKASEQLLVDENFQSWTNYTASTASPNNSVVKTTMLSNESLTYTMYGISIANSGWSTGAQAAGIASSGYLKMAKTTEVTSGTMSIITSAIASITKITFVEATTGSSRGFQVWKKGNGDADWVSIYNTFVNPSTGVRVSNLAVNGTNVQLKFTNLAPTQNAYLTDLQIYGDVSAPTPPTVVSVAPVTGSTIPTSGSISIEYSENVTRATANDITLGGVAVSESDISVSASTVTINYSGLSTDNSYVLNVPAGAFKNSVNTVTAAITSATFKTPDTIFPTASNVSISNGTTLPVNGFISFVMSETCKAGSANVSIGSKIITPAVSGSNSNLIYINYSGLAYDTDYTLTIPTNAITDVANNSYVGTTITFHTEVDAKGTQLFSFTPDATSVPGVSSGTVSQTVNGYTFSFDNVQSAGARAASPYTYSFKTNSVTLPTLPSVGELSFYIQSGGGSVPQEYYIQKLAGDGVTWNTIETFIIGTNDRALVKTAAAQSSIPTTLRLMYNSANLWLYFIDVYQFNLNGPVDDGLNPSVASTTPIASGTDVAINGSIKMTYSENVSLGSGNITLNGVTLSPGVVGKNITLPYANLHYSTAYTLDVPAGAFKDLFNNPCGAFTLSFTTKAKPAVTPKLFDFVVAQDGSGNGTTIQSAFNAVPLNNATPYFIFVKNGTYNEYPTLAASKDNVSIIGQSRDGVIITGSHYSGLGAYTTSTCQTVEIMAKNLYMENVTIENTAGLNAGQAVALKVYGDKNVFKNVKLFGYQDTHLTSNVGADRQYYLNCDIRGSVDFIFGNGACFFESCLLYMQDRPTADVICAPSTAVANNYGYVFNNCTIDGASSQDGVYNLGRPWQNSPRAVYLNTKMNILASTGGWISMSTIPALFAEYATVNSSNNSVSLAGRNTSFSYTDGNSNVVSGSSPTATLTTEEAANYTMTNVLGGGDSWDATLKPQTTAMVENVVVSNDGITWNAVDGAICYVVLKDEVVIGFSSTTNYSTTYSDGSVYKVIAVSEFGALSSSTTATVDSLTHIAASTNQSFIYSEQGQIVVNSVHYGMIEIYSCTGVLIQTQKISSGINSFIIEKGMYIVRCGNKIAKVIVR
ncbi:MAG: pectinesterase family protein [Bacteroidales bacterium]|nr:pectinesterase family protein [Bacteroidales bacterium]